MPADELVDEVKISQYECVRVLRSSTRALIERKVTILIWVTRKQDLLTWQLSEPLGGRINDKHVKNDLVTKMATKILIDIQNDIKLLITAITGFEVNIVGSVTSESYILQEFKFINTAR